ncbi:MAG: histidine kinase, partial [Chloroflexaceae bacterium]|nr:histidine kinase [Chloroflexaceae bacterium]
MTIESTEPTVSLNGADEDVSTNALLRITTAIETATTLDELLMLALYEAARMVNVTNCGLLLLSDDGQTGQLVSTYPPRVNLPQHVSVETAPYLQYLSQKRQVVQVYDIQDEPITNHLRQL